MSLKVTILESVGSCIDDTDMVYPLKVDGTPDTDNGTPVSECCDEWWDNLSNEDYVAVTGMNEYTDEELSELEFISKYKDGKITDLDASLL